MTRPIADASLEVFKPTNDSSTPDLTIPGSDLEAVSIDARIQDAKDKGTIDIDNSGAQYFGEITSGDRLVFETQLAGETSLTRQWTAIARTPEQTLEGGRRFALSVPATDFVFTVLSWRLAYQTFDDAPIAGSNDAILDTLLSEEAPEIGTSQIGTVTQTTDAFLNGRYLFDVVVEDLADIADVVVAQDGTDLVFKPLSGLSVKHALEPTDFRGSISVSGSDDELANLIRVDGGTDHASDASQPVQDGYERVTDTSRLTTQIETRKSEVARIKIHTKPDPNSSDGISVRLQADRDGAPVAVGDTQSDIARRTLADDFLAADGLTTFIMPAHSLAPQAFPWLIIEADGADGHDIGIETSSGAPTYEAEYPFPLLTRLPDADSQREYRRRDHRIKDESLDSFPAVRDKAQSYARHHSAPDRTLSGEAESIRAHNLQPGEAVDLAGWGDVGVSGTWLCLERSLTYDGESNRLSTELKLQDVTTL